MNWTEFAESLIGALLAVAFLVAAVVLTVLGHTPPNDLWAASFAASTYAAGALRKSA